MRSTVRVKLLLAISCLVLSSCSVFKKTNTDREKLKLDSSGHNSVFSKLIDTSSFKSYSKITIKGYTPQSSANPFALGYPWHLINSAEELAAAANNLKDSLAVPFLNPSNRPTKKNSGSTIFKNLETMPGNTYDITIENWTNDQKGITDLNKANSEFDVTKKTDNDHSVSEGSSKLVWILCICGGIVIIIIVVFIFLYTKSGKSWTDIFKNKI